MTDIFRKSSLEKLLNPDQLDRSIRVTSPISWLVLVGVALIIVITGIWGFKGTIPTVLQTSGIIVNPDNTGAIYSDYTGTVSKIYKSAGSIVEKGEVVASVTTVQGDKTIVAKEPGVITAVLQEAGTPVFTEGELFRFTPQVKGERVLVCYVPIMAAQRIKEGMKVLVYPSAVDTQKTGHLEGEIIEVSDYPVSTGNMWYVLGMDNMLADQFLQNGPVVSILCSLKSDKSSVNGLAWSGKEGKNINLPINSISEVKIITEENAPITKLFSNLKEKIK